MLTFSEVADCLPLAVATSAILVLVSIKFSELRQTFCALEGSDHSFTFSSRTFGKQYPFPLFISLLLHETSPL